MKSYLRKFVLLIGDWAGLYGALFVLMVIRYGRGWQINWDLHLRPFSFVFPLWILVFFGSYLYETRRFRFNVETVQSITAAVFVSLIASITAFYAFPPGLIHPRRNMVIFAAIYAAVAILWRWGFYQVLKTHVKTNLLFLGKSPEVDELISYFRDYPHLGYNTKGIVENFDDVDAIRKRVSSEGVRLIVVADPAEASHALFELFSSEAVVIDLEEFYERIFHKVSPDILTNFWFIRNLENINLGVYELSKRMSDIVIALAGLVLALPVFAAVAPLIKLDSKGPVIFKQTRVGKNNGEFLIYKFRTMRALSEDGSAEVDGPQWAADYDVRVTRIGRILRKTRLDELPQLWNVLMGNMSFVGPRPERPEFVRDLAKNIPYYNMRHLIKPGLTGWAQINYEYGNSIEDAKIKLQYDIYYAKKRSPALDLAIILKTIKTVLTRQGQ